MQLTRHCTTSNAERSVGGIIRCCLWNYDDLLRYFDEGLNSKKFQDEIRAIAAPTDVVFLDAKFESELVELEPEEPAETLAEDGQGEVGLDQISRLVGPLAANRTLLRSAQPTSLQQRCRVHR